MCVCRACLRFVLLRWGRKNSAAETICNAPTDLRVPVGDVLIDLWGLKKARWSKVDPTTELRRTTPQAPAPCFRSTTSNGVLHHSTRVCVRIFHSADDGPAHRGSVYLLCAERRRRRTAQTDTSPLAITLTIHSRLRAILGHDNYTRCHKTPACQEASQGTAASKLSTCLRV